MYKVVHNQGREQPYTIYLNGQVIRFEDDYDKVRLYLFGRGIMEFEVIDGGKRQGIPA